MIEMHGRFSPDTAAQLAAALEPYAPRWIEEPVPPENAAALHASGGRPGHRSRPASGSTRIWDARAVHRGRQRRHHPGGSHPLRWVHRHAPPGRLDRGALPDARAAQRRRAGRDRRQRPPRGRDPATSTSSSTSTTSPTAWVSELVDIAPAVDPLDGCFAVPDRPGLGVRLDREACARHPRTSARLRLFTPGWQKRQGA